jgi:hypothetical protein
MINNKVFGRQYIKQSPIEHHNLENYQWYDINEDIQFNIHNYTVKRLYWLQIPRKITKCVPCNKCYYWNEALAGIPEINRKKHTITFTKIVFYL